jgi:tetratricopeptide (TPR) repeat protein
MKAMPENVNDKVRELKSQADYLQMGGKYLLAIDKYKEALSLLPKPVNQWKYIWVLLPQIAENYWLNAKFNDGKGGGFQEALAVFSEIMKIEGAVGDETYHLRIGQIRYELGQIEKAKDELLRAYLIGGKEIFMNIDNKYFELIKPIIETKSDKDTLNEKYEFQ